MSIIKHRHINPSSKKRIPKKKDLNIKPINKTMKLSTKNLDDIITKRYMFISIFVVFFFLIIIGRLFKIQILDYEKYRDFRIMIRSSKPQIIVTKKVIILKKRIDRIWF